MWWFLACGEGAPVGTEPAAFVLAYQGGVAGEIEPCG